MCDIFSTMQSNCHAQYLIFVYLCQSSYVCQLIGISEVRLEWFCSSQAESFKYDG